MRSWKPPHTSLSHDADVSFCLLGLMFWCLSWRSWCAAVLKMWVCCFCGLGFLLLKHCVLSYCIRGLCVRIHKHALKSAFMRFQFSFFQNYSEYICLQDVFFAIAQAVSSWLPTAAARVRVRVWSCGICGGQSDAGADFLRVLRFPLPIFIPPNAPKSPTSIIWGLYNRPEVTAVPRDLVPPHKKKDVF
jgi:hypothetical protein